MKLTYSGCVTSSPLSNCGDLHTYTCTPEINTCSWCSVLSFVILRWVDAASLWGVCRRSLLICEEGKYGPCCQSAPVSSHTLVGVGRHVWCLQTAAAAETCELNRYTIMWTWVIILNIWFSSSLMSVCRITFYLFIFYYNPFLNKMCIGSFCRLRII